MGLRRSAKAAADYLRTQRMVDNVTIYAGAVAQANLLSSELRAGSDGDLRSRSGAIRAQILAGADPITHIPALFALVREVAERAIGLRPFDVQLLAGMGLAYGKVVQMHTGEGKTLAAVAPVALHAFAGRGVHVLTFNDYLARRDAEWMGPVYRALGLNVGFVQAGMSALERKAAYEADVTYVTAKEAGFDFLRDAIALAPADVVHRPLHMALVDEADSILIDEARIPLVMAGEVDDAPDEVARMTNIVRNLRNGDHYAIDRERNTVHLTERGVDAVEDLLGCDNLFVPELVHTLSELNAALYAQALMHRDVDYIVRDGRVEIVDEFTGRSTQDRHWPDGLQAAIESKEGLRRTAAGRVLGQITLQHFLLQYRHVCGMTATAEVAATELEEIYGLEVQVADPNKPCIRADHADVLFTGQQAKQHAVIDEVARVHATGRPVLVGTLTVAESESLAAQLHQHAIQCNVLNAKRDDEEARIVADAGRLNAVTISTNMAGRGTDIRLGGVDGAQADDVIALGGLYVIGTNRHDSRRIDDQLRGRAGRQGDPGETCFFVSLEDDLVERSGLLDMLAKRHLHPAPQTQPIENAELHRLVDAAQRFVEGHNADIRRGQFHFARLVDQQRQIVHTRRTAILTGAEMPHRLHARVPDTYARAGQTLGREKLAALEQRLTLLAIDQCWSDHLAAAAEVKESVHLTAISGRSPFYEFQKFVVKAFEPFFETVEDIVAERFTALDLSDLDAALDGALRGPSSTWTYLADEDMHKDAFAKTLLRQLR